MDTAGFLTIYATFEAPDLVREVLPSVVEETVRAGARLIVHDCSVRHRAQVDALLADLGAPPEVFVVRTDRLSMAHARNLCLGLGIDLFAPEFIAMLEDDHGYRPGFIDAAVGAMRAHFGRPAPNGMRFGLFSGCAAHAREPSTLAVEGGHTCPGPDSPPKILGGANSCCRIAPTHHWLGVLRGYDLDGYPISNFQTSPLNLRNYHRGFTRVTIAGGALMWHADRPGRGVTDAQDQRLWDPEFAAADPRARFRRD